MLKYYLGLGSNLGDRKDNLSRAITFLDTLGEVKEVSSIYETEPVGMSPGTGNFYNQVVSLESAWSPQALLGKLKEFEAAMGRDLKHSHNQPRILDLDILLAGDCVLNGRDLVIPHPQMTRRAFVMMPLTDIAPNLYHPVLKKTMTEILENLQDPHSCSHSYLIFCDGKLLPFGRGIKKI